jgi:penicillin-binding protein 1A
MGYDEPKSLGGREFGATLALPIWIDYMRVNLANKPPNVIAQPAGVVQVQGDWMLEEFVDVGAVRTLDVDPALAATPQASAPKSAASFEPSQR